MKPKYFKENGKARKKYVASFADCDYIDELSPEDQAWLSLFLDEYYDNVFKKDRIHTEELKKQVGQVNNERRRDAFAIKGCSGNLAFIEDEDEEAVDVEDALIAQIDMKNKAPSA